MWLWAGKVPGRGNNRGKDQEAGMTLEGSRNNKEPRVTAADE